MKIEIAIKNNASRIDVDTDITQEDLTKYLEAENRLPLRLTTKDGITYLVPRDSISYIRVGEPRQTRVGFGF